MRSLVEVCAEQRAENWREAEEARELRDRLAAQGRRMQAQRRAKGRFASAAENQNQNRALSEGEMGLVAAVDENTRSGRLLKQHQGA